MNILLFEWLNGSLFFEILDQTIKGKMYIVIKIKYHKKTLQSKKAWADEIKYGALFT
jgi:hypothetical protein